MKNISNIWARAAIATGFALGSFALAVLADYTNPTFNPPSCPTEGPGAVDGCNPPLHNGYGAQVKHGGLDLVGQNPDKTAMTYGLIVENAPIYAQGGLRIQNCSAAAANCPDSNSAVPEAGRIWLVNP